MPQQWAVDIRSIFTFFVETIRKIGQMLDSFYIAPGVSLLTLFICGLFVGLTIAMFVRSGKT